MPAKGWRRWRYRHPRNPRRYHPHPEPPPSRGRERTGGEGMRGGEPAKASLDDLVGKIEDPRRDRQPNRLRGAHIDDHLEPCCLLHRKLARRGALEYPVHIAGSVTE